MRDFIYFWFHNNDGSVDWIVVASIPIGLFIGWNIEPYLW